MLSRLIRGTVKNNNINKYYMSKEVDISDARDLFMKMSSISKLGIEIEGLSPIVVHGSQSSGKTSVIEAISGFNLFPKKNDIATLKPMDITTIQSPRTLYKIGNDTFYSEVEAAEKINRLNSNPAIEKISVVIQSPKVYNTFFKDLPGLCFLTQFGDKSFPEKVKEMHISALEDKNNIPIIINPGPTDPATNLALQLSHQYKRNEDALGIITKTDLTENQKTNMIKDMLNGKKYALGHGYIATVLRSGKDIDNNMTIEEKMKEEKLFFKKYSELRPCGVETIRKKMSNIQFQRIKKNIPDILLNINAKINDLTESKTILDNLIKDPNKQLPERLADMLEKLVTTSPYKSHLEMRMKKEFLKAIRSLISYNSIPGEEGLQTMPSCMVPCSIRTYLYDNPCTDYNIPFTDLFSYGAVSPIPFHNTSLYNSFDICRKNGVLRSYINFYCDTENVGFERMEWYKFIERYFKNIEHNTDIDNLVYDITERMLLEYIYEDKDLNDELTKKFAEYVVKLIGSKAYEDTLRFAINTCVTSEQEPEVDTDKLVSNIIKNNPDMFKIPTDITGYYFNRTKVVHVKVFGHEFNKAYIQCAMQNIASKCARIVNVHLMKRMVPKSIEMLMDISNKENAMKEKSDINDKIYALEDIKKVLNKFV